MTCEKFGCDNPDDVLVETPDGVQFVFCKKHARQSNSVTVIDDT